MWEASDWEKKCVEKVYTLKCSNLVVVIKARQWPNIDSVPASWELTFRNIFIWSDKEMVITIQRISRNRWVYKSHKPADHRWPEKWTGFWEKYEMSGVACGLPIGWSHLCMKTDWFGFPNREWYAICMWLSSKGNEWFVIECSKHEICMVAILFKCCAIVQ